MKILMIIIGLALCGGTLWLFIRALRYARTPQRSVMPRQGAPDTIDANTVLAWTAPGDMTVFDTQTSTGDGPGDGCQAGDSGSGGDSSSGDCAAGDGGSSDGGSSGSWD